MAKFLAYLVCLGLIIAHLKQAVNASKKSILERTGPFKTIYAWKEIDLTFPSESARIKAKANGTFVSKNIVPLGVEVYKERIFLTLPKWKQGIPVSLGYVPRNPIETSPKITPYPNWKFHNSGCNGLTAVFRMKIDECGRLWVMDTGKIDLATPKQVCPPQLFIFDLKTDKLILQYSLPNEFVKQDTIFANIQVDIRDKQCDDAYAYISDLWRYAIVVFSLKQKRSWRSQDPLYFPDPFASSFKLNDLKFVWTDGILGMALSPVDKTTNDRVMYFHPMSSFHEFYVKTSALRNETVWNQIKDVTKVLGQSRGDSGQSSTSAMDNNGVLFFNRILENSVGCWDSKKPYIRKNLGIVGSSNVTLMFPSDVKINFEGKPSVWVLSNRLPVYFYSQLNPHQFNFRVLSANIDEAINGTICDPRVDF